MTTPATRTKRRTMDSVRENRKRRAAREEPRESRQETTARQESPEASKRFSRYRVSRMMDGYTAAEEWLQQGAEWLAGLWLEMRMQGTKPGLVACCSGRVCWRVSPLACRFTARRLGQEVDNFPRYRYVPDVQCNTVCEYLSGESTPDSYCSILK